jgi:hypothetical protein
LEKEKAENLLSLKDQSVKKFQNTKDKEDRKDFLFFYF